MVEDEHRIANTLKKGLEQERFAVDTAYDGPTGFDLAAGENYDLIILDLLLPGLSGLDFCRRLRAQKIHTPILILTAKSQTLDKVAGLDAGADDYLTKPFSFAELLARVRALSRRPKNTVAPLLSTGSLTLDPQRFLVKKGGRTLLLSKQEFNLLEYLLRHAGQTLTKEKIINGVWNYDADILPNTVEVYIRHLRQKGVPVKTVRGFGYKLG